VTLSAGYVGVELHSSLFHELTNTTNVGGEANPLTFSHSNYWGDMCPPPGIAAYVRIDKPLYL